MLTFTIISTNVYIITGPNGVIVGRLLMDMDGYFNFWAEQWHGGFWEAYVMRQIADKLDELNAEWDKMVQEDLTHVPSTQSQNDIDTQNLRIEFAKAALTGLISDRDRNYTPSEFASTAFIIADAMLRGLETCPK